MMNDKQFPERDLTKAAEQQGIFRKFDVRRVDGSDSPGGKHHGCRYFVLDLDHDQYAPAAMRAYATACAGTHPELAADIERDFGVERAVSPAESVQIADMPDLGDLLGNVFEAGFDADGRHSSTLAGKESCEAVEDYFKAKIAAAHAEGRRRAMEELATEKERADRAEKQLAAIRKGICDLPIWEPFGQETYYAADIQALLAQPLQQEGGKEPSDNREIWRLIERVAGKPLVDSEHSMPELISAIEEYQEQAAEDFAIIDRLGKLLAGVAVALKGPEPAGKRYSYHDLPEIASKLMLEVELHRLKEAASQQVEETPHRINLKHGAYITRETKTSGESGWLLRNEHGLVRALNGYECEFVDCALAATPQPSDNLQQASTAQAKCFKCGHGAHNGTCVNVAPTKRAASTADTGCKKCGSAIGHDLDCKNHPSQATPEGADMPPLPEDMDTVERIQLSSIDSSEFAELMGAYASSPTLDTAWAVLQYADKRMHAIMARRFALAASQQATGHDWRAIAEGHALNASALQEELDALKATEPVYQVKSSFSDTWVDMEKEQAEFCEKADMGYTVRILHRAAPPQKVDNLLASLREALAAADAEKYDECKWGAFIGKFDRQNLE